VTRTASEAKDEGRLNPLEIARRIAFLCQEKSATDLAILDMRAVCDYTDFFVIAVVDDVLAVLKQEQQLLPRSVAGLPEATWIVADYLDVVLHVFTAETRAYYRLEDLWSDVPSVELAAVAAS
jgi:ribosome-associated protein